MQNSTELGKPAHRMREKEHQLGLRHLSAWRAWGAQDWNLFGAQVFKGRGELLAKINVKSSPIWGRRHHTGPASCVRAESEKFQKC